MKKWHFFVNHNRKRGKINAHWNGATATVHPSFEKEETDDNLMVYSCSQMENHLPSTLYE